MADLIGYARVSSKTQNLDVQLAALAAAGVEERYVYKEKVSGTKRNGREQLQLVLDRVLREGDTLVVTRLDRLARSLRDLQNIAHELQDKGVSLRVLEQAIDTTTPEGRLFFNMLGAIAEFETEIRKARQLEGIEAAKAKGAASPFKGRPATIDAEKVKSFAAQGMTKVAIANRLEISRDSVYRLLKG